MLITTALNSLVTSIIRWLHFSPDTLLQSSFPACPNFPHLVKIIQKVEEKLVACGAHLRWIHCSSSQHLWMACIFVCSARSCSCRVLASWLISFKLWRNLVSSTRMVVCVWVAIRWKILALPSLSRTSGSISMVNEKRCSISSKTFRNSIIFVKIYAKKVSFSNYLQVVMLTEAKVYAACTLKTFFRKSKIRKYKHKSFIEIV